MFTEIRVHLTLSVGADADGIRLKKADPMTSTPTRASAIRRTAAELSQLTSPPAQRSTSRPPVRRYDVSSLLPDGSTTQTRHLGPALPLFEEAFCAFSRGSLIETESGPVAIEDLFPGDMVISADGDSQPLIWKGHLTVVPGMTLANTRNIQLTRIMTDSFGLGRPSSYLVTGPSARLLYTPDHLRAVEGGDTRVLTPVSKFVDGVNVIETAPPASVDLYHICLPRHAVIRVAGLEFETYHPDPVALRMTGHAMRSLFLNLFPHIERIGDFGALSYPRDSLDRADSALSA